MLLPYGQFRWQDAILTAALAAPAVAAVAVDALLRRTGRVRSTAESRPAAPANDGGTGRVRRRVRVNRPR